MKRVRRHLERFGFAAWAVIVLTLPPEQQSAARAAKGRRRQARLAREVAAAWVKHWNFRATTEEAKAALRVGGVQVAHPEGETPGNWQPHLNLLFPLVAYDSAGTSQTGRWSLPAAALDDLRARWAAALEYRGPSQLQVFYEFRIEAEKKAHALRYFFRTFPAWRNETHRIAWFGHRPPAVKDLPWDAESLGTCPDCRIRRLTVARIEHHENGTVEAHWLQDTGPPPDTPWAERGQA